MVAYSSDLVLILAFVLVTGLGLVMLLAGKVWKYPVYTFLGGCVFVFGAVAVYPELGVGWILFGLALGLILMYEGADSVVKG